MSKLRSAHERTAAIAELAYRMWEERGRPEGSPEVDWYRAESEIDRGTSAAPPAREEMTSARPTRTMTKGRTGNR